MYKLLITKVVLATALLTGGVSAQSQLDRSDPIAAAVLYAVSLGSLEVADRPLVLDVRRPGLRADSHDESLRPRLVALAKSLGARPGSLNELMVCPKGPPSPEEYLMTPCRFKDRVAAVIQVSAPRVRESEVTVNVTQWTYTEGPTPRTTYVAALSQEVILAPEADGQWKVVRVGKVSHARM